jgi:hypothetical protein
MKVKELIEQLEKVENKDIPVYLSYPESNEEGARTTYTEVDECYFTSNLKVRRMKPSTEAVVIL